MPLAMTTGGVTYYLAYDQVGSLRAVTDTAGNLVKRIDYDSFGNILADSNSDFAVPFGFAGGLHDRDANLVRFGYRDYDPEIGRWTAKDPIGFMSGDTDLFGYVLNDPVNFVDPDGLIFKKIVDFATKFASGKSIKPIVEKYVSDPRGQRIIVGGVQGAAGGLISGVLGGAAMGAVSTGPLAGVGAAPGALIGGLSGSISGFATGLLYATIKEIFDVNQKIQGIKGLFINPDPC
jgi:RHS repeat-associated protein